LLLIANIGPHHRAETHRGRNPMHTTLTTSPSNASNTTQGARRRCATNKPLAIKRTGRPRSYCSDRCRDAGRRQANFAVSARTRPDHQRCHETPKKAVQVQCFPAATQSIDPPRISGPRNVLEAELIARRQWHQAASRDGVICQVAQLAPRALDSGGVP
jgi:hypothetical protein